MTHVENMQEWRGQDVVDVEGTKIGKLEEVYAEAGGDQPVMGAVKVGLIGGHRHLVPLTEAAWSRDHVRIPFAKDLVVAAPQADDSDGISRAEEVAFARHYGFTVADVDDDTAVRYESSSLVEARREAQQADRRRAEEMAEEAHRLGADADRAEAEGSDLLAQARDARQRRDELLAEAARVDPGTTPR